MIASPNDHFRVLCEHYLLRYILDGRSSGEVSNTLPVVQLMEVKATEAGVDDAHIVLEASCSRSSELLVSNDFCRSSSEMLTSSTLASYC